MNEIINLESKETLRNNDPKHANTPKTYAQVAQKSSTNPMDKKLKPKQRRNIHIGTGEISEEDSFIGRNEKDKKIWIFISRVPDKVSEQDVTKYIKKKANIEQNEDLVVKHVPTRVEKERSNSKCFQVGIRYDLMDTVYNHEFWPANVAYERFKFKNKKWEEKLTSLDNNVPFLEQAGPLL